MPQRLWLVFFWVACAAAQSIQGTVVNTVTGNGVPGVKVELFWSGDPAYSATTDGQGHFRLEHVQAGAYTVEYTAPYFQWGGPFQRPPEPRLYRATAGNTVEIVAHMMPMGRLSGRVVDGAGEPVPKAVVEVVGPGMQMNFPADGEGNFKFDRFTFPGAYTLSAVPPSGFHPPARDPDDDRALAWTRTWYPGVTDAEGAGKIVLAPGGVLDNIELKLRTAAAHAVRGMLLNPDGTPAPKVDVSLGGPKGLWKARSADDGSFEFAAVVDGEWRLIAEAQPSVLNAKLRANQPVAVAGRGREGIKLQLHPPIPVTLRAVAETPENAPVPKFNPRPVMLVGAGSFMGQRALARSNPDGTYNVDAVYPGAYDVGAPAPPGYYLAEIRLGGAPVSGRTVDLAAGAVVSLVYRADGGTVRGTVENCSSGGVVLVPQDAAARGEEDIRRTECDDRGQYEFAAVRPGGYYILAQARDPSAYFWTPRWSNALMNQAVSVSVRPNETVTLDLKP
jgi:Carboxypeptidase regulatory-like domain